MQFNVHPRCLMSEGIQQQTTTNDRTMNDAMTMSVLFWLTTNQQLTNNVRVKIIWMCSFVFNEEKHIIHGIIDILFLSFPCPTVHVSNFFVHTSHNPQPDEFSWTANERFYLQWVGSIIFDVHENYSKLVISLLSKITNNYSPIYDMIYTFDSITVSPRLSPCDLLQRKLEIV